ncbi:MAG: hypothetical protein GX938_02950, partial [Spirochaetales bacterium]|nr:hypothetical protein [Spirochaetales bacterium]
MAKDYYDDMEQQLSRHGGRDSSSKPGVTLILTIVLGIVICVAVIIIWYVFSPQANREAEEAVMITQPAAQVAVISDAPAPPEEVVAAQPV